MHVCAATLAIFWDSGMLVSKIDECIIGDGFDCYRRESMLKSLPLDCTTFNESVGKGLGKGLGIVCYKIQVDFPMALTEAGGVPVTSATILLSVAKGLFYFKVGFRHILTKCCCCRCKSENGENGKKQCCKRESRERTIIFVMAAAQIILLIAMLGGIICALAISQLWNYLRSDGAKLLSTLSIVLTIYAILWIPWYLCYFEIIDKGKKKT